MEGDNTAPVPEKEPLERRSSKSRLSKQEEVEETEDDHSPSSETSDATVVPAGVETPTVETPSDSPESNSPDDNKHLEQQKSTDSQRSSGSDKSSPTQIRNPKMKQLVRGKAVCDDASPPPDDSSHSGSPPKGALSQTVPSITTTVPAPETLSPTPQRHGRHRLEKEGSSHSSISENGTSPALSRDSSMETYTDSTGIDLEEFIKMTLNKNTKDRIMLLKLEQDMNNFIHDTNRQFHRFGQMTSYHRMLVHRIAAFFGLDHNVDQSGKSVIINRTANTRIPDFKFRDYITDDQEDQPKRLILRRDRECASFEEMRNLDRVSLADKKSKSFEEREEEYHKARARIFNQEDFLASQEGPVMAELRPSLRSSKEDVRWMTEKRPWSSTDSSGYSTDSSARHKASVTKASSFGGMSRGESHGSSYSGGRMSKAGISTDSLSSGTSSLSSPMTRPPPIPCSPPPDSQLSESGSSSLSTASPSQPQTQLGGGDMATPNRPVATPAPAPPFTAFYNELGQPMAIWVATTLDMIPPGVLIINPQTGQPCVNPDGSVYQWQPSQFGRPCTEAQPQPVVVAPPGEVAAQQQQQQQQQQNTYAQVDQRSYPVVSAANDGSLSQFAAMTITRQSSADNVVEAPPPGGQQVYMPPTSGAVIPQITASMHPPPPQQTYAAPPPPPPPQVQSYNPGQVTGGQQVRYMYPVMTCAGQQSQGSCEVEDQVQSGSSQVNISQHQCGSTGQQQPQQQQQQQQHQQQQQQQQQQCVPSYPGYQVMGFPQMTVQSVEYQQGYQAPQQQGASVPPLQDLSAQYQAGSGQGAYVQTSVPVYYSTPSSMPSQGMAYQSVAVSSQGAYRPRTPPTQVGQAMCQQPSPGLATGNMAQPVSTPHYVSYTTYPQNVQTGVRPQAPQLLSQFPNISAPTATQAFPMARSNMQIGMQMGPTRTSPPPQGGIYPHTAVTVLTMDQKTQKSAEYLNVEAAKDMGQITQSGTPLPVAQIAALPKGIPTVMPLRPAFRPPVPMVPDTRLLGQPLQQMPCLQITPMYPAMRPRLPAPTVPTPSNTCQLMPHAPAKASSNRRSWARAAKDSTSPLSSTESVETGGITSSNMLEVTGVPSGVKRNELDSYLADLSQLGGKLQVLAASPNPDNKPTDLTILAIFDSEGTANHVLSSHRSTKYNLQPAPSRQYHRSKTSS